MFLQENPSGEVQTGVGERSSYRPPGSVYIKPFRQKYLGVLTEILKENFKRYFRGEKLAEHLGVIDDLLSNEFKLSEKSRVVVAGEKMMGGGGLIIPEKRIFYVCQISSERKSAINKLFKSLEKKAKEKGIDALTCYVWLDEDHEPFLKDFFIKETIKNYPGSDKIEATEFKKNL